MQHFNKCNLYITAPDFKNGKSTPSTGTIYKFSIFILCLVTLLSFFSCKKIIEIKSPVGSITTSQVFSANDQAIAATTNLYYNLINTGAINSSSGFASSSMTVLCGMSSDELVPFDQTATSLYAQFMNNKLLSTNNMVYNSFWKNAYSTIYNANAIIEKINNSTLVDDSIKKELLGEAKFIRAFCNFYLTNLFGDIPLVTSLNWHNTSLLSRSPASEVYKAIISDLKDANNLLSPDFLMGNNERIFPTKWAAAALLARTYLYLKDWGNADENATKVINETNTFNLEGNLNNVFLYDSKEAIWQLKQSNSTNTYNATPEGYLLIPRSITANPFCYLNGTLLSSFEPEDLRRYYWIDSVIYNGVKYFYPKKYKEGPSQAAPNNPYKEYYIVLRLAEVYLIRAEAKANQNFLSEAIADLNEIRNRAGLVDLPFTLTKDQVLSAVEQERKIELFAEWGHRWLDLKRTERANAVLSPIKPDWNNYATLYPIPLNDIKTDPNLFQNPGY
ncbi:RagB/SusD family nutrient uptake outer membrane protein [Agriterribacter humi]|uniref:RagB/SusD family nutrient uptake outer membrane protein n=1 Tax=Agriterribacter humi TaxID=1104781 RepID=UPI001264EEC3|nr:RagB/SusD family nutrient uptake outer membrane protein [Agriterribacter humi]